MKLFKIVIFILISVIIIVWVLSPNMIHEHAGGGHINICESHLKEIGSALEIYSADNHGNYPVNLDKLLEKNFEGKYKYMKTLPVCPGPEDGTPWQRILTVSYKRQPYGYKSTTNLDNFTLWCGSPETHIKTGNVPFVGCWPQYSPGIGVFYGLEK